MKRLRTRKTLTDQLTDATVDAALSAVRGDAGKANDKRALTGPRAVAAGAVLYTAVRAAFVGGRFIRMQRASKLAASDESDEHAAHADPRRDREDDTGEVASSTSTTSRPKQTRAPANSVPPSLALPNQRWPRMAAEKR